MRHSLSPKDCANVYEMVLPIRTLMLNCVE